MTLCKYCHDKKMTLQEYEKLESELKNQAQQIVSKLKYNNGLYFNSYDILNQVNPELKPFIIKELKNLGIEFYNNNELYRVTE